MVTYRPLKAYDGTEWVYVGDRRTPAVFKPENYGPVDAMGTVDSSAAINAAIQAAYAVGGGTVKFPAGTIRWDDSPTLPHTEAAFNRPAQPPLALVGAGSVRGRITGDALTERPEGAGTVLRMGGTTGPAQLDTRGRGALTVEKLSFWDPNETAPIPFIQTTNTQLAMQDVTFFGALTGAACNKDAIILGGTDVPADYDPHGPSMYFQGYGSAFRDIQFNGIRRGFRGHNAVNAVYIENPVWSTTCGGGPDAAAIEFDGSGLDTIGNLVVNATIEVVAYTYGVRLGPNGKNTFINPGFYDPGAPYAAAFYLFGGSGANVAVGGNYQVPIASFVASDGNSGNDIAIQTGSSFFGSGGELHRSALTTVQPTAASASNDHSIFEVRRSVSEETNPNTVNLRVQANGAVRADGPSAQFKAGNTRISNSGVVSDSGPLALYAGTEGHPIQPYRGYFRERSRSTDTRPSASGLGVGTCYYDTTVGKPVWSDGTVWRDATGVEV